MTEKFDLTKVKLDPNNPGQHAHDCPCEFCQEVEQAIEKAAQKFLTQPQQNKGKKRQ